MEWIEEITDEMAIACELGEGREPVVWAASLHRELGREGAIDAVLMSGAPPAVRRVAMEALAR